MVRAANRELRTANGELLTGKGWKVDHKRARRPDFGAEHRRMQSDTPLPLVVTPS
ncbi:MAG TPA: hypothetical protein VE641_00665 [Chthoniobacterales bacterium]|nr:hypothetical protein [Chthoniobacterales bacterium]